MKIKKNNWWNRIFHKEILSSQASEYTKCKRIVGLYPAIAEDLNKAVALENLLEIHKFAWKYGFRNENLGPCEWGMFRTKDILNMTPDEVYLGNIWGLSTKPITFWNDCKDEEMSVNGFCIPEDTKIYDLIKSQYSSHLHRNFNYLNNEAKKFISEYEKVNKPKDPFKLI